ASPLYLWSCIMTTANFVHTCCRCMWPFGGLRTLGYFDAKKNEDHDEEEANHLLGNVIDSDDEQLQADALSPDQIKRFLDASKSSRSSSRRYDATSRTASAASASASAAARRSGGEPAIIGAGAPSLSVLASRSRAYDELLDEDLDEPDNLGAKLRLPARGQDEGFSPVDTGGRGLGFGGMKR
ncbi:unnamed protein product, partial [Effrenium voratum]